MIATRLAGSDDAAFIEAMLVEAANWDTRQPGLSRADTLAIPEHRRYVEDWPRETDVGVVAVDERGRPVGAAWFRSFPAHEPGYGFVAEDIPELAIAVASSWRRQGVGCLLLARLEQEARGRGVRALSLSVAITNPAQALYRRRGYRFVAVAGGAYTMLLELARS